jgi:mannose-6-phosphate isomerase-like protein (cupin superfamily)
VRMLTVLFLLTALPLLAEAADTAAPVGFGKWTPAQLQEMGARLEKKLGDKNLVFETLSTTKGHSVYLVLRGKTAPAEYHETESDIQIGVSGSATFVIGGELVDPKKLPRKQQQGSGINGGARFPVGPGDVIHVPVAVPHVLIIDPKKPYLYILIKLDEEPREPAHD